MTGNTAPVTVFDSKNLLFHGLGATSLIGAVATGLIARGDVSRTVNLLHALFAFSAVAVWTLHLARAALNYLKGAPLTLLAGPGDAAALLKTLTLRPGAGNPPPGEPHSYREKIPYTAQMALLPLLVLTGLAAAHPSAFFGILGATGLVSAASSHLILADASLLFLAFHLYFAMLRPEALWLNASFITGKKTMERHLAMKPWLAEEPESETGPGTEEERVPTVEELLNEGNLAAREGKFKEAAGLFTRALELYPGYPQALFNLGACLRKTGENRRAREILEEYLKQDAFGPASARAREILAEMDAGEGGARES